MTIRVMPLFQKIPFTRKQVLIGAAILIVLVLATVGAVVWMPKPAPQATAIARRGDLSASINATGKVRAKRSARLALPMSGLLATIEKQEGDQVSAGDVIATLRAEDAQRRVKQAELTLSSRTLDLARIKSAPREEDIEIARASLRKATLSAALAEAAHNASPTTQTSITLELTRADLDIARASFNRVVNGPSREEIDSLQNSVTYAQIELDSAKIALTQTKLLAPFDATIIEITARVGELVGGFNPLATIADLNALEVAVEIDEIDIANAQIGQNIEVRFDAFPGERFAGKLTRIFPAASTQRGSTVYNAIVEFDPREFKVRVGMGANVKILTLEKKNTLVVPNRALKNVGTRKAVRVLSPGAPRDALVEVGVTDGNNTEIISGLNEGDVVLIN
jgi:RND family efflux transporter MFP subunit